MKSWILFFLGTLAYFLWKYINRSKKTIGFSFKFWIEDNWPELLLAFVIDFAFVLILLDQGTVIDLAQITWWPVWLIAPTKLIGSFLIGYGGGLFVYKLLQKKVKNAKG